MSKRSKKNRQPKLPVPRAPKQRLSGTAVGLAAMSIIVALGIWWWTVKSADIAPAAKSLTGANESNPATAQNGSEFQKLKGRWLRPDGGYIVEVKSVDANGAMDAAYFNPKSIRVAKAEASRDDAVTKVFIELRDVNYPGSTYSLTYDPASDQLKGIYYQAVERQRFEVAFVRVK